MSVLIDPGVEHGDVLAGRVVVWAVVLVVGENVSPLVSRVVGSGAEGASMVDDVLGIVSDRSHYLVDNNIPTWVVSRDTPELVLIVDATAYDLFSSQVDRIVSSGSGVGVRVAMSQVAR